LKLVCGLRIARCHREPTAVSRVKPTLFGVARHARLHLWATQLMLCPEEGFQQPRSPAAVRGLLGPDS
jgi:hypothetical protein